jgi:hypothetical protein
MNMNQKQARERLEYLRGELRAERISYGELAELQNLAEFIEPGDTELLEPAGVPEFPDSGLANEGFVQFASGEVISLQCAEGRCSQCPDETGPEGPADDSPGPLDHGLYCEHGCAHGPAAGREPDPEPAHVTIARLERVIGLLTAYGDARFGDEWWPGNARNWIPEGRELEYLLDPGSAELADAADIPAGPEH